MSDLKEISYRNIVADSLPMMISSTTKNLIMTVNLHYATGNVMAAGLGLSMILVNSVGGSMIQGFNTGFSTHASRAFGANNRTKFGIYCIQGLFNLLLLLVLLIFSGLFTQQLCLLTGQQEEVAAEAHRFYVWQLPGLCCLFSANFLRSLLNSQAVFQPFKYVSVATCMFHIAISAVLSRPFGFYGIILSTNLTFMFLLALTIATFIKHSRWPLDRHMFVLEGWSEGYKAFFQECFYVALPKYLDQFMFEFMALYVGSYKVVEQTAAHIWFSNIVMINGSIISGYATACMIKAGHLIGMNHPKGLRLLIRRGILTCEGSFLLQYSIVAIFHAQIFRIYTEDQAVLDRMKGMLLVYFLYGIFDTMMFIGGNIYKALKQGAWTTKIFTLGYYGVGGATLFVLSHVLENKILVAWLGFVAGSMSISLSMWLKSRTIDLDKKVEQLHTELEIQQRLIPLQQHQRKEGSN